MGLFPLVAFGATPFASSLAASPRPLPIEGLPGVKECLTTDPQGRLKVM